MSAACAAGVVFVVTVVLIVVVVLPDVISAYDLALRAVTTYFFYPFHIFLEAFLHFHYLATRQQAATTTAETANRQTEKYQEKEDENMIIKHYKNTTAYRREFAQDFSTLVLLRIHW